jgi:catechol 2,3-dioxygenase-like lactoylglutathione lyase family enzyme
MRKLAARTKLWILWRKGSGVTQQFLRLIRRRGGPGGLQDLFGGCDVERLCCSPAAALPGWAQERPPIVGVAHIGLKTNNLAAAREFYGHVLGYQEPFTLDKPAGGLMLTYFKVNDHQYIEVFPELKSDTEDRLSHIAFETTNIQQLRDYLASKGVKVPDTVKTGLDGNVSMMLKDPDGHNVEFVEYRPGSLHTKQFRQVSAGHARFRAHHPRGRHRAGPGGGRPLL